MGLDWLETDPSRAAAASPPTFERFFESRSAGPRWIEGRGALHLRCHHVRWTSLPRGDVEGRVRR